MRLMICLMPVLFACGDEKESSKEVETTTENAAVEQSTTTSSTTTQDMLSELDAISSTITPRRRNTQALRTLQRREGVSDFGVQSHPSRMAGERSRNYTTESVVPGAARVDRLMSGIVFTT